MSQQEAACRDDTMHRARKLMASCLIMSLAIQAPPPRPAAVPTARHYVGERSVEVEDEGGTVPRSHSSHPPQAFHHHY